MPQFHDGVTAPSVQAPIIRNDVGSGIDAAGNITVGAAGAGFKQKEGGAAARQGVAILVAGTLLVATTAVTALSRIYLTIQAPGGAPGFLQVSARVAGVSFTILSSNGADTSTVAWLIVEPA